MLLEFFITTCNGIDKVITKSFENQSVLNILQTYNLNIT